MKQLALLLLLSFGTFSFAQSIKLTDLTGFLTKKSVNEIKTQLESKGWLFYEKEDSHIAGVETWVWTYSYTAKTDKAVAWMSVGFDGTTPIRAQYEIFDYDLTAPFSSSIYDSNFKFEHIEQDEKEFTKRYANDKYYLIEYDGIGYETGDQFEVILKESKADVRNGVKKTFYDDGQLKSEYTMYDGKLNGKSTSYYEDGTIKKIGTWRNDKEHGLFQFYNEDGTLDSDEMYMDGKLDGPAHFYFPNGKLQSAYEYKYGKKSGLAQEYDEAGNLEMEYKYIGGEKFGEYKEYTNGIESFKCFYLSDKLSGPYTQTLFNEDNEPYATVKGSYKDDFLDGTIVGMYLNTKDTLSIRKYANSFPVGEWRYYSKAKKLTKRIQFKTNDRNVMQYFEDGIMTEEVVFTKEDADYWYFTYVYNNGDAIINASYRIPFVELEPNQHVFTVFEDETQIFEDAGVVDSYYKYGPYLYENKVLKYSGNYNESSQKFGKWSRLYKASGVNCELTMEDGVLMSEYFLSKKGKPYSGKIVYEMSGSRNSIAVKNGLRNGVTEEKVLADKTVYITNYINGEPVE